MKKLVIYKDVMDGAGKSKRHILRSITPNATFVGYYKNGTTNHNEFRKLAAVLEPSYTGFYIA